MGNIYSYDDVVAASTNYFDGDDLAARVFADKYALRNNDNEILELTPDDMHRRMAKEFARIERSKFNKPLSEDTIYNLFKGFKRIVPQGSPMYGIGNPYQYVSIANCFVLPSPLDSYAGITYVDALITQVSSRRGGVGWDISNLRPKDMPVKNAAKSTTGMIPFMVRYSNTVREVGQSGRRGASLQCCSIKHPEIEEFMTIKQDLNKVTGSNISVKFTDDFFEALKNNADFTLQWPVDSPSPQVTKTVKAKDLWDKFIHSAWLMAEPGCMFFDTVMKNSTGRPYGHVETASNPCVTGDTLVYVADGRGYVSFSELANQGDDVDVFCLDKKNKIVIRKMRNPRKTKSKAKILKITLDDGSSVRCTENHKFLTKDGTYIEAKDLVNGQSLFIITRIERSMKDTFKLNNNSSNYYWLYRDGIKTPKSEHRLIAEHKFGKIEHGYVVHHIDFNSKNNSPNNLMVLTKEEHDAIHRDGMIGDKNPMRRATNEWSDEKWTDYKNKHSKNNSGLKNKRAINITNDEIFQHGIILTNMLGRRFSQAEWKEYAKSKGIPSQFSKYRIQSLGSILDFSICVAQSCGFIGHDVDTRLLKTYQKMIDNGYNAAIINNECIVEKICEHCNNNFSIDHNHREVAFCSLACSAKKRAGNLEIRLKAVNTRRKNEDVKKADRAKQQLKIFNDLKFKLGRKPLLKEWEIECENIGIAHRTGKHSFFSSYQDLINKACLDNHKVISVVEDGYEDVYNGTVDEYHNYFIGGFEHNNQTVCLNTMNCGEQFLTPYSSCRLIAINLTSYVIDKFTPGAKFDYANFAADVKLMQRLGDDMVDLEIESVQGIIAKIESDPEPQYVKQIALDWWNKVIETARLDRRTGCGFTGLGDAIAQLNIQYGSQASIDFAETMQKEFKRAAYESSIDMAQELGAFPQYNPELDIQSDFIKRFKDEFPDLYKRMTVFGRRNMVLLTIAPTGTVSCLTQTTSGIEPAFMLKYTRRKKGNPGDANFRVDFVDQSGDSWMHFDVYHHQFLEWMKVTGKTAEDIKDSPYYNATANEINWLNRVALQSVLQKHIDNSISTTVNLPNNATEELVSEIYLKAYQLGCKGMTIYRDGCRTGVLVADTTEKKDEADKQRIKRPKELPCDVHHIKVKGKEYFVLVGLDAEGKPYEVFAGRNGFLNKKIKHGKIVKLRGAYYKAVFEDDTELSPIVAAADEHEEIVTRLVSVALRNQSNIDDLVDQLEKVNGDMYSFGRAISRTLKKYIEEGTISEAKCPECNEGQLVYQEGCKRCLSCSYSACK